MLHFVAWLFLFIFSHNNPIPMAKYFFIIFLSLILTDSFAQVKKSQLLVYGDNEASWAAAVQSARSGVNTLWIRNSPDIGTHFIGNKRVQINSNHGLDAGVWAEFLQKTRRASKPADSASILAKQDINSQIARNVFTAITDSLNNLTILFNTEVKSINKSGNRWKVALSSNENIKVGAIIDGTNDGTLLKLLNNKDLSSPEKELQYASINTKTIYNTPLFRTGLVAFEENNQPVEIPANSLLNLPAQNFFFINHYSWLGKNNASDVNNIPLFVQTGQAIGASAAYCAFFKTTHDKINIRTLQGELIAYHGQLIPFQDIDILDVHFPIIQRIGATGVLKGAVVEENNRIVFNFNPLHTISSKEIQPIILNLYTRSQIWFHNKDIEKLKLNDLLSLIKFTALKGDELDADVKKGWKQRFKFDGEYDLDLDLTRRHAAVLIDYYLKPFHVKIDEMGAFKH